jgi:hypothetical protein
LQFDIPGHRHHRARFRLNGLFGLELNERQGEGSRMKYLVLITAARSAPIAVDMYTAGALKSASAHRRRAQV